MPPEAKPLQDINGAKVEGFDNEQATYGPLPAPTFTDASFHGATVRVTFSEELDSSSRPEPHAFPVTVDDQPIEPVGVQIVGKVLVLTLPSALADDARVTLGYVPPEANPLQDINGAKVEGFDNEQAMSQT